MPHLSTYIALADGSERTLAESLRTVGDGHAHIADIFHMTGTLAKMSDQHREQLAPVIDRYGEDTDVDEPERLQTASLVSHAEVRSGYSETCRTSTSSPPS